jgi:ribonuclease BN (tRNA processing enzyme)
MSPVAALIGAICATGCVRAGPSSAPDNAARPSCAPSSPASSVFELAVLGSGGPVSYGRAASGYVVLVDGVPRALVDVGPGAFVRLGEMGLDLRRIDAVFVTHLHIDHSGDLPGFVKSRDLSFSEPLLFRIFGPGGRGAYPDTTALVDRLFGAQGGWAYLPGFRNALRFEAANLPVTGDAPIHEVLREPDYRVTSVAVEHGEAPAVAFRIEHAGHAVVVTGDLASKSDTIVQLAMGADLLVYDTAVLDPPGSPPNLYDLHTAPSRIGEVAAKAGVKSLLLSHITPDVERAADAVLQSVRARYAGPTRFASDCLRVDLAR